MEATLISTSELVYPTDYMPASVTAILTIIRHIIIGTTIGGGHLIIIVHIIIILIITLTILHIRYILLIILEAVISHTPEAAVSTLTVQDQVAADCI